MKSRPVPAGYLAIAKEDLVDRINRLPVWARRYIHDLETRIDPSGDIRDLADFRDQRDGLLKIVEQLKKENRHLRRALKLRRTGA